MTRAPKDAELLATGKILALFATLTEGGRRRVRERLAELDGVPTFTATPSGGVKATLPNAAHRVGITDAPAGGHEPGWDMRPPPLDTRSPGA